MLSSKLKMMSNMHVTNVSWFLDLVGVNCSAIAAVTTCATSNCVDDVFVQPTMSQERSIPLFLLALFFTFFLFVHPFVHPFVPLEYFYNMLTTSWMEVIPQSSTNHIVFMTLSTNHIVFMTPSTNQFVYMTPLTNYIVYMIPLANHIVYVMPLTNHIVYMTPSTNHIVYMTPSTNHIVYTVCFL